LKLSARSIAGSAALAGIPFRALAAEARPSRISYFKNGEIHVSVPGGPEGKPLTTGHWDFKPSWSKTGDMLVCFRRLKDDPVTEKWKTAIFIINVDGSGFHTLSDGSHTDFNPTWTRDGENTPIWNRKDGKGGVYTVMQGRVGGKPGEELAVTADTFHNWAHSCLMDGRILVSAWHPQQGYGVYLLTRKEGGGTVYERVQCDLVPAGELHRASISSDERKICFEYLKGHQFQEPGHTLYVADFDARALRITNPKAIANEAGRPVWFAYPRWIHGDSAVVYHSTQTGRGQLYLHQLRDGSTKCVSADPSADYRYPHGEAAPC
jgi:Tol biopolymer transport system component